MPAIEVVNLCKRYAVRPKPVDALRHATFEVEAKEVFGLLGPNGAGKTTLLKIICRLLTPTSGSVKVWGASRYPLQRLGVVLEGTRNLYWRLTALENLIYYGVTRGTTIRDARARGRELLERFGVAAKSHSTVQLLSRGMQQKVAIAAALIHRPQVLILDEPTLGLDVRGVSDIEDLIRQIAGEEEAAVLLATHDLSLASSLCGRVAIIDGGRVLSCGSPEELIRDYLPKVSTFQVIVVGLPEPVLDDLRKAGVTVEKDDESCLLSANAQDSDEVTRLLRAVLDTGAKILDVRSVQASLKDVIKRVLAQGQAREGRQ